MRNAAEIALDRVIYELRANAMVKVGVPARPKSMNFLIVSHHGAADWSGFRTLEQIEYQLPSLDAMCAASGRADGFYRVVER